ncbi:MAG: VanZ family protein [Bacteroidales bacterium]|nr:VanZ family protein [Bacteroidales bacterium]
MTQEKEWRGIVVTILFAILILILSIIPPDISGSAPSFYFPGMDKIIHALMYGSFTVVVLHEFLKNRHYRITTIIWILSGIFVYSVLMEILQLTLIAYRSGDVWDILANLTGILSGTGLMFLFRKIRS